MLFFFIMLKVLSKFQELLCGKGKQNLFGDYMFRVTVKDSCLGPKFLICLKFYLIWKEILCHIFLCSYAIF